MTAAPSVLSVRDLVVAFGPRRVVDGVSLDVRRGEIVGLVGETGSGKSLTALAILRLLPSGARMVSGDIVLDSRSLATLDEAAMRKVRGARIAWVPQDAGAALDPTMRIAQQVGEPLVIHTGTGRRQAAETAVSLLDRVGLEGATVARRYPNQLSGGMQQRAAIAMALALAPPFLLADEPTTALDPESRAGIASLLRASRDAGTGILFISHDLRIVAGLCDRVYVLWRGQVVESGTPGAILDAPTAEFTRRLVAAMPPRPA